jgi:methyltransferase-like protein
MSENFMPSTISELVSKAETHGFMYLVDTGNMDSPPFSVKSEVAEIFQEISGDVQKSQYVDFLTGRPVRQVLFCKNDLQVSRNLNPDILSRCRMLTNWLPILSEDGVDVKKLLSTKDTSVKCDFCLASRQDVKINVNSPVVSAILYALSSKGCHYPSLEELEDEVRSILGSNFIRENFLNELLPMYFNGLIGVVHKDVHQKIATSYTDKDHLRSFSPARYLAARSQIAPNICHKLISLTAMQRYILVQFDGTKDTLAILEEVDNQISSGKMTAERDGKKISGALLHEHVREQISILQRAALFEESN